MGGGGGDFRPVEMYLPDSSHIIELETGEGSTSIQAIIFRTGEGEQRLCRCLF
jgi:hypothetical protein